MKDGVLIFKNKKSMEKDFQEIRKKISRKHWFGWAGGYGNSKKN